MGFNTIPDYNHPQITANRPRPLLSKLSGAFSLVSSFQVRLILKIVCVGNFVNEGDVIVGVIKKEPGGDTFVKNYHSDQLIYRLLGVK